MATSAGVSFDQFGPMLKITETNYGRIFTHSVVTTALLIFLVLLAASYTIIRSFGYDMQTGGTDLRSRIVGTRLQAKGLSAYFHKWTSADGEKLLDPNDLPSRLINGNTVTPAWQYVLVPLSWLRYPLIRLVWTAMEILAAAAVLLLMLRNMKAGFRKQATVLIIVVLLFCTDNWYMHVERGQTHIFYALMFSISFCLYDSKLQYGKFASGMLAALFVFFRPFAIAIPLGFLRRNQKSWLAGWVVGLIAGLSLFVAPKQSLWQDYFSAMKEYGNFCLGTEHEIKNAPVPVQPKVIEGEAHLRSWKTFPNSMMSAFYVYFLKLGIPYSSTISWITCCVTLGIFALLFLRLVPNPEADQLYLFAFLCYLTVELLLLNWRNSYSLMEWAFAITLMIRKLPPGYFYVFLVTGLFFINRLPFGYLHQAMVGELLLISVCLKMIFDRKLSVDSSQLKQPQEWPGFPV